jgi:hypothetical protein
MIDVTSHHTEQVVAMIPEVESSEIDEAVIVWFPDVTVTTRMATTMPAMSSRSAMAPELWPYQRLCESADSRDSMCR